MRGENGVLKIYVKALEKLLVAYSGAVLAWYQESRHRKHNVHAIVTVPLLCSLY